MITSMKKIYYISMYLLRMKQGKTANREMVDGYGISMAEVVLLRRASHAHVIIIQYVYRDICKSSHKLPLCFFLARNKINEIMYGECVMLTSFFFHRKLITKSLWRALTKFRKGYNHFFCNCWNEINQNNILLSPNYCKSQVLHRSSRLRSHRKFKQNLKIDRK